MKLDYLIFITHIEEHDVAIRVSVVQVNPLESLRKLDVADFAPRNRIHHETHGFPERLAVIDIVVAVDVQDVRRVGEDS
ncbi:unnamed protein product [Spirodela intermedia]|uniref:Uncharacterized protein n=1 Tax=Spirodela intermedia TaxID=51605 RepID=A0A7I8KGI8_SPIIN|nr:unnamed protein product [Spirodela intermedia]